MEFGVSTFGWRADPLDPVLLDRIRRSGWRKIELFGNRPHLDYTNVRIRREIADWFRGSDAATPDLHLPFYEQTGPRRVRWISALHSEERERQAAIDETRRALELTDLIKVGQVVVHLGVPGQPFNPVLFDHAYRLVDTVHAFAGVRILLETLPNEVATPQRLAEFIDVTRFDGMDLCHDLAHTPLGNATMNRIRRLHLSDPDGGSGNDDHPLGTDAAQAWSPVIETLVSRDYTGDFVFEVDETDLARIDGVRSRIVDLEAEARGSIEEFRERYGLPAPQSEEE